MPSHRRFIVNPDLPEHAYPIVDLYLILHRLTPVFQFDFRYHGHDDAAYKL